ncbi:MAG TPA: bacterial transcriptional activator domain-containing protein [Gaiellaceae bacterium]|nr:bacterial transcriptional activator domain-containing protein [Gaiellaceae bacterium]
MQPGGVLGPERLTFDDGMLALGGDVDTDVEAFESAAAGARADGGPSAYAAALDPFGGELLPKDRYEPWAEARRASLNDLHGLLCLELAQQQSPQDALRTLQRALDVDPLLKPAHRALMRVYETLGRRQDALAQYQRLRAALRRSLEAKMASFVGRERELADELAQARVLTLTGPGGSGKTRLEAHHRRSGRRRARRSLDAARARHVRARGRSLCGARRDDRRAVPGDDDPRHEP